MDRWLPFLFSLFSISIHGQSIAPAGAVATGGHGTSSQGMLSWSVGQVTGYTFSDNSSLLTSGIQQPDLGQITLRLKVMLGGAFDTISGLMRDDLRTLSLLPSAEPYAALGFSHAGPGGNEQTSAPVLLASGNDAVVDWLFIELRDQAIPGSVIATRSALVQRDGDVVEVDGSSAIRFPNVPSGNYYIAVRHRNHLGIMTSMTIPLNAATTFFDMSTSVASLWGTSPVLVNGTTGLLWSGNTNADNKLRYSGSGNDRDPIIQMIYASVPSPIPTSVVGNVYSGNDVNMDGSVKYAGANNDRDPILVNIGGTISTATRWQQLP